MSRHNGSHFFIMEDGGKEDTTKPTEVKISGKAGWLKKSSGKFFGTYKDRYIHLEHTEIVVYENEDMKTCLERLDLENYDKCHELRGPFKKKNRLILIRAPKCANKVHDVKLQAQNQEEKDAWIKALSDGINRAKNKIFDEVKVEEGCTLEHVTRSRPKGNRGRRPPTRIHMKEVANVSSDGILRLDLNVSDSTANGTFHVNTEDSTPKEGTQSVTITSHSPKNKPTSEEATPQKKILKPPMPPSKQNKPATPSEEDTHAETTSDSGVDTGAPPTPSKPSSSQDDLSSDSSSVDKDLKPPKPPSKDKKPTLVDEKEATETPDEELNAKDKKETEDKTDMESEDKTVKEPEDKTEETTEVAHDEEQDKPTNSDNLPPTNILKPSVVMWDTPLTEASSEAEQAEVAKETQPTPEPSKKSTGPPAPPKKKPVKCPVKTEDDKEPSKAKDENKDKEIESTSSELISDSAEAVAEALSETNTPSMSPEPPVECEAVPPASVLGEIVEPSDVPVGKVEQEEEKSVDSGQHSAEESENGDAATTTTSSTTTATGLLGGQTTLDEDSSEADETDPPNAQSKSNSEQTPSTDAGTPSATEKDICRLDSAVAPSVRSKPQILSPRPLVPLKPTFKARSASLGDLLTDTSAPEKKPQAEGKASVTPAESDMKDFESEVTLEIKNTEELLHTVSDQTGDGENQGELLPEVLLATAMEKLRKAEEILCVAKSFKEKKTVDKENKRMSW